MMCCVLCAFRLVWRGTKDDGYFIFLKKRNKRERSVRDF